MAKLTIEHTRLLIRPGELFDNNTLVERAALINLTTTKGACIHRLTGLCNKGIIERVQRGVYQISGEEYIKLYDSVPLLKITKSIAQYVLKDCKDESLFKELLTEQKIKFTDVEFERVLEQLKCESETVAKPTFDDVMRLI